MEDSAFLRQKLWKEQGLHPRRYLVHMAEMGETKEAMMEKTNEIYKEFSELIDKFPADATWSKNESNNSINI